MDRRGEDYIFETRRKGIHLFALVIPLGYLFFPSEPQAKAILVAVMVFGIVADIFRLSEPRLRGFFHSLMGSIMRPHERTNLLGSTSLLIATVMTVFLFSKPVAVAALCLLIGGDTAAALVGKRFGRTRIFGRKTLEGSLAFVGAGLVLNIAVSCFVQGLTLPAVFVGAAAGAVIEAVPFPIDDNFAIPIISGVAMVLTGILKA